MHLAQSQCSIIVSFYYHYHSYVEPYEIVTFIGHIIWFNLVLPFNHISPIILPLKRPDRDHKG